MEPFLGPLGHIRFDSATAFLAELTRVFGDSDEEATAARELAHLRQGNREFTRYYADFIRLTTILEYNNKARRHALERGLSSEMLDGLRYQITPPDESFNDFINRLKGLDDSIRRRNGLRQPNKTTGSWRSSPPTTSNPTGKKNPGTADRKEERDLER